MRILLITNNTDQHGWGRVSQSIIAYCEAEVVLLTSNQQSSPDNLSQKRLKFLKVPSLLKLAKPRYDKSINPFSLFDPIKILIAILIYRPDKIVSVCELFARQLYFARKFVQIPSIFILHGTYAGVYAKYNLIPQSKQDKYYCVSSFTRRTSLVDNLKGASISVKPLGVDKSIFYYDKSKFKSLKLEILADMKYITFVGRSLKERKGFMFLHETCLHLDVILDSLDTSLNVVIPGLLSQAQKNSLENMNHKLKNIKYIPVGFICDSDLRRIYSKALLNVLPSKPSTIAYEGFGLVHLEAACCSTPSVGCYDSGNTEACSIEGTYLVHYGDVHSLGMIILDSLKNRLKSPNPLKVLTERDYVKSLLI